MQRNKFWYDRLNKTRRRTRQIIQQCLHIILTKKLACIFSHNVADMGCHNGFRLNNNIAICFSFGLFVSFNPASIHPKCWLFDINALKLHSRCITRNSQLAFRVDNIFTNNCLTNPNTVLISAQGHIITHSNCGDNKSKVTRDLFANACNAVDKGTTCLLVNHFDQAIAKLNRNSRIIRNICKFDPVRFLVFFAISGSAVWA